MGKSLVIVESPAKAKTINRYLGDDFIVKSSVGHIRDLPTGANRTTTDPKERARQAAITRKLSPEDKIVHRAKKAKSQLINSMGIDPDNDWKAEYATLPGKEKVVAELKKLAKNADTVYLATDMDREGEAIAWHLTQVIGGDDSRYKRVVFNEITKKAIRKAFEDPGKLNTARVDAQQARRFLDRVVGFMVSPLLWEKVGRGLSAGRVQSVALKMIVEREREIRAFIPEEYWTVQADLEERELYLATDMDREGEAIAWHLTQVIGGDDSRYKRVVFNEITKKAIRKAFEDPGKLNTARVDAQQARRFLDRVVGFMVSPLLWEKVGRGLSAGRVQSVALKMIVEREREIRAFIPEEYWTVQADLEEREQKDNDELKVRFDVRRHLGKAFRPVNQEQADTALASLREADYAVSKREDKPTKSKPSAPFITSTLQQAASTRLGFGVKKTMMMAQRLYEAGYITYMRTDSTHLGGDAVTSCREYIQQHHGAKYLPDEAIVYSSKSGAQEAHEAIRPSKRVR